MTEEPTSGGRGGGGVQREEQRNRPGPGSWERRTKARGREMRKVREAGLAGGGGLT